MFEGYLRDWLTENFGEYLTGIEKDKLKIAAWAGNIEASNIGLNPLLFAKYFPLNKKI